MGQFQFDELLHQFFLRRIVCNQDMFSLCNLILIDPAHVIVLLFTVNVHELRVLKSMLASGTQIHLTLAGSLAVLFNELWLLPWMLTNGT